MCKSQFQPVSIPLGDFPWEKSQWHNTVVKKTKTQTTTTKQTNKQTKKPNAMTLNK